MLPKAHTRTVFEFSKALNDTRQQIATTTLRTEMVELTHNLKELRDLNKFAYIPPDGPNFKQDPRRASRPTARGILEHPIS